MLKFNKFIESSKLKICNDKEFTDVYEAFNEGLKLAKNEWIVYANARNDMKRYFFGHICKKHHEQSRAQDLLCTASANEWQENRLAKI